ncbi:fructose-bisphosphate aldolase [Escherichia coli]|uniref:fructose-bisphosphate aldolase n=1 Tax=Escherichia coli TaxID=562 RepID=A0A377D5T9_ECOLX|nr:fructose-bisphosphate aldolase [Escherichia coli]
MVTVLWAYLRNSAFKKDGVDYHVSADLTGQANHLAATIGADIVKQKMAENNGGYKAINYGYTDDRVYSKLTSENPIDLVRYQLANCYMGRAGLINSAVLRAVKLTSAMQCVLRLSTNAQRNGADSWT